MVFIYNGIDYTRPEYVSLVNISLYTNTYINIVCEIEVVFKLYVGTDMLHVFKLRCVYWLRDIKLQY